ncbi:MULTISPECIES: hypothetical protein [Streptomyces]|uniref:Uncharacterized protein n=1 Tax=Streptomyces alboflavus TaxID=67267 RepID=A0A1Z1WDK4_9ACTN|nr:hypothetical protein [Streptomyces alboflavus]ARX84516.1 hypothetical protein SMD44_03955 [Streptomyces alboflavus]
MSNEPYDPYQQYPQQQPQPQQYPYPPQQQAEDAWGHQDPYAQQYATQQWEGQTWDTQVHAAPPVVDVTETAYLPPQSYAEPPPGYPGADQSGAYNQAPGTGAVPARSAPWAAQPPTEGETAPPVGRHRAAPEPEADSTSADASGYGPATLTGNPRVTDAQRARAEGRSPIIEPGMQPALLTAVLGLLLAGGAAAGQYALLVPLVILQAVTAAGWFRLNGMWPARQGIALAFLGGVAADVALLATGEGNAPAAILGTLGVWVLLVLVLQLRSRAGADERMAGLMATLASSALAIIAAGHLAALDDAATVGGVAVAAAVLARALPLPTPASVVVALLAAAGAGIAVGGATDLGSEGALLGLAAGVCAVIGHRVASYDYPSRFVHFTAGVALPLAAAAPAVYLLGRALG